MEEKAIDRKRQAMVKRQVYSVEFVGRKRIKRKKRGKERKEGKGERLCVGSQKER